MQLSQQLQQQPLLLQQLRRRRPAARRAPPAAASASSSSSPLPMQPQPQPPRWGQRQQHHQQQQQQRQQRPLRRPPRVAAVSADTQQAQEEEEEQPPRVVLEFGSAAAQGPRPTMEDELRLEVDAKDGFTFAAVFDGHGGETSARWLRDHLLDDVVKRVDAARLLDDDPDARPAPGRPGVEVSPRVEALMVRLFQEADAELLAHLLQAKGRVTGASGATGTVALVHPRRAVLASLGDSLAVLCRAGAPVALTAQHRVYGFGDAVAAEIERVEAAGGWVVDGRVCNVLAVSRAFGDPEFKGEGLALLLQEGAEKGSWPKDFAAKHVFSSDPVIPVPDVSQVDLNPETDEFLVVATDGLWDAMPPAEVVRFARSHFKGGRGAQEVAEKLVDIALKRYTADNVAVVVADLRGRGAWAAAGGRPAKRGGGGGLLASLFGGGGGGK